MAVMGRQVVSMPFVQGVDSKTDPYLALKPSRVENRLVRGGTLQRRYGTRALTAAIDTGGTFSAGQALFAYDAELIRINGGTAYALGPKMNRWVTKPGGGHYSTVALAPIQRNARTQSQFDQASTNGVSVFAWVESAAPQQGIHVAVQDETTGTWYQSGNSALSGTSSGGFPRLVVVGRAVLIFWKSAANLVCATLDTASPETVPSGSNIRTDMSTTLGSTSGNAYCGFDACAYAGGAVVAYVPNTSANNDRITVIKVTSAGAVASSPTAATFATMTDIDGSSVVNYIGGLSVAVDSSNRVFVVYSDSDVAGSALAVAYYTVISGSSGVFAALLGKTIITSALYFFNAALIETATGEFTAILSSISGSSAPIQYAVLQWGGVGSAAVSIPATYGLNLASDAVMYDGSVVFAAASVARGVASSTVQPTGFILDLTGGPVARCLPGSCDLQTATRLPRPAVVSGTTTFLFSERGRLAYSSASGNVVDVTPRGMARMALALTSPARLPISRVGRTVHVGGAVPRIYDGQQVVEEGFPLLPEGLSTVLAAGGSLSAGAYQWRALYSWVDASGQLHRSAVSPAVSATATATQKCTVTVPTLPASSKDLLAQGASVQVELYRTTANGTLFYRASSVSSPTFNTTSASSVSIVDTLSDASLITGELLYTTGGVYDWLPPPAYALSCAHKQRLVIAGLEDPYVWRSSSVAIDGETLRFNEAWGGRVPSATGVITALSSMDGNLIIFTEAAAYLVQGDGPDLLGNNGWPDPQLITALDSGPNSASVISAAAGVFFRSSRGWMLLTRGLGVEYIGADVERYSGFVPRCAVVRAEFEEVWFQVDDGSDLAGQQQGTLLSSPGGVCLVYNSRYQQWSVLTNYGAQDACYWRGKYVRARSDGAVLQEQPGAFDDSGAYFSSTVETSWLKPAQLVQGYQRVWRAAVLGAYGSDATLTWDVAYDYSPTYSSLDTVAAVGNGFYTPGGPFQLRRHLRIQKCEALKFRLTDSALSGTGQGIGLTSLDLEFGGYGRLYLLPAAQSK